MRAEPRLRRTVRGKMTARAAATQLAATQKALAPIKPPRPVTAQQISSQFIRSKLDAHRPSATRRQRKKTHAKWKRTHREFTALSRVIDKKKKEVEKRRQKKWRQQNAYLAAAKKAEKAMALANRKKDNGETDGATAAAAGPVDASELTPAELSRSTGPLSFDAGRADTDIFYAFAVGA